MKQGYKNILALIGLFLLGLLISNTLLIGVSLLASDFVVTHNTAWLRISQCFTVLCSFVCPALYMLRNELKTSTFIGHKDLNTPIYCYSLLAWLGMTPLVNLADNINHRLADITHWDYLTTLQSTLEAATQRLIEFDNFWEFLVVILIVAILAAFAEELFFRGAMQSALIKTITPTAAIIIVAGLFSAMHGELLSLLPRFMLGVLFGYLAWRTKTLTITILLHILNNTVALLATHYQLQIIENIGTGDTWYLCLAGAAITIYAIYKIEENYSHIDVQ